MIARPGRSVEGVSRSGVSKSPSDANARPVSTSVGRAVTTRYRRSRAEPTPAFQSVILPMPAIPDSSITGERPPSIDSRNPS